MITSVICISSLDLFDFYICGQRHLIQWRHSVGSPYHIRKEPEETVDLRRKNMLAIPLNRRPEFETHIYFLRNQTILATTPPRVLIALPIIPHINDSLTSRMGACKLDIHTAAFPIKQKRTLHVRDRQRIMQRWAILEPERRFVRLGKIADQGGQSVSERGLGGDGGTVAGAGQRPDRRDGRVEDGGVNNFGDDGSMGDVQGYHHLSNRRV